jgi:Arc/MetJ family transcription regulator
MHRTTVMLDDDLYREVKRKAIDRARPMRTLVEEALRTYLGLPRGPAKARRPKFGVYHFRIKGDLRRETIYRDRS